MNPGVGVVRWWGEERDGKDGQKEEQLRGKPAPADGRGRGEACIMGWQLMRMRWQLLILVILILILFDVLVHQSSDSILWFIPGGAEHNSPVGR